MGNILFLAHRLPYPPNKGDKVRSYHLLKRLAERHHVRLGTFVDDPADLQHAGHLRTLCSELHLSELNPRWARARSARGLLTGDALSVAYYRDRALRHWVDGQRRSGAVDAVVVFSSTMLQYAKGFDVPLVVDYADVDSEKWAEYGRTRRWPLSWVFRREAATLAQTERSGAQQAHRALFATAAEAETFRRIAPDAAGRVAVMPNGVDSEYFAPRAGLASPYAADEIPIVFTGTMDFWPNVEAVCWFATEVLPGLQAQWPGLRFHIVGRHPTAAVRQLAGKAVSVTGAVADVRPYMQHARVIVAPVRLARGVQNKVLEAMAMGRPVVATARCAQAIDATVGRHLLVADSAGELLHSVGRLLGEPRQAEALAAAARQCMLDHYNWGRNLAVLDAALAAVPPNGPRR